MMKNLLRVSQKRRVEEESLVWKRNIKKGGGVFFFLVFLVFLGSFDRLCVTAVEARSPAERAKHSKKQAGKK